MKQHCKYCGCCISKRKVTFDKTLLLCALKAYQQARKSGGNIVKISDIKNLSRVEYTRMNNLVRFGLAYKKDGWKKGFYGLPLKRIWKFLNGEWSVASCCLVNPLDKSHNEMSTERIYIDDVPSSQKVKEEYGETFTEYVFNEDAKNIQSDDFDAQTQNLSLLF